MNVSEHAKERLAKRLNINKKAVIRQAELSIERGYALHELSGNLKKWATTKVFQGGHHHTVRVYNNLIFIFDPRDMNLVTAFHVPSNMHKLVAGLKKKRENKNKRD